MTITLVSGGDTLTLPVAIVGESDSTRTLFYFYQTEDGSYRNIQPGGGDVKHRFLLSFNNLSETNRTEINAFLATHAADLLTYTDHRGNVSYVRYVSTPSQFTVARDNCRRYNLTIELEEGLAE